MKYHITLACGHIAQKVLFGTPSNVRWHIKRIEKTICKKCGAAANSHCLAE